MIKKDDLLDLFERMARENWAYAWGAAREGCVDCSGAFVYAYRQVDSSVYIAHGSNSILRQSMGELLPMSAAQPGYAAVKVREWSEAELGNRWYGQAPGDCYHIGLVGRDGKILNAKGTAAGFVASAPDEGWDGCAPLLAVDYKDETEAREMLYKARVTTQEDPLRVRAWAQTGRILGTVPRGAVVDVLADSDDGWPRIQFNELLGYASAEYLERIEDAPEDSGGQTGETTGRAETTTLISDDGVIVTLIGHWGIADD